MNYPLWETTRVTGGSWIALIAILHVYISHLAVGGGIFIWLTDRKAWRENSAPWHDWLRRHTWFFLYLTMVFGGVSGVGIWFIIALVNPTATSILIHQFVFGWAIEWVFFLGEIVALLLYAYRFPHLNQKGRQTLSFFYALFAWLSLLVINGILTFMLTPGRWLETYQFWDGFFNPTFFPALCFRTAMSIMIAGLFGLITAVRVREVDFRAALLRYCSRWLLYPVPVAAAALAWYYRAIPSSTREVAFGLNPEMAPFLGLFATTSAALFLAGVFFTQRGSLALQRLATAVVVVIGLGWIGGFEYIRELSRRPFLITGLLYSNSILVADQQRLDEGGVLRRAHWTAEKDITATNQLVAGRELFNLQCLSCHSIGGGRNDIRQRVRKLTYTGILAQLTGQGRLLKYMPPVMGTRPEREALARYVAGVAGQAPADPEAARPRLNTVVTTVPGKISAGKDEDQYALWVWSEMGMRYVTDMDAAFALLPPSTTLEAQVIKCGLMPEIAGESVVLTYRAEPGFENPAAQAPSFWDFAQTNYGVRLEKNQGLTGNGLTGQFAYEKSRKSYVAKSIPVLPYATNGGFNPYPLFLVEARDAKSGRLLAATKVVAPVTTEMGCRNCHGGGWRMDGRAGLSRETADNILWTHDRIHRTELLREAAAGKPQRCQSCHADSLAGATGRPGVLNLSAAIHGWHANYMPSQGAEACAFCHASDARGSTRCYRGIHSTAGLTCVDCHGTMADHALALLKGQSAIPAAAPLMAHLQPVKATAIQDITARSPWQQEPDCLSCHAAFQAPKPGVTAFNHWTGKEADLYRNRADEVGLRCAACHGATHAEYPALNPYHPLRDNLPPLQQTGKPLPVGSEKGCPACHLEEMEDPPHHPNMIHPFRTLSAWEKALSSSMNTEH